MVVFLLIGCISAVFLILSMVLDDIFSGLFEALDFGDGFISGPTIFGFLTAFGFGGALAVSAGLGTLPASGVGSVAGLVVGGLASLMTRSMMNMPTDATPTTSALEGLEAVVVTNIPEEGTGEITVRIGGQPVKISARSVDGPIASGSPVRVSRALSPTSVIVSIEK